MSNELLILVVVGLLLVFLAARIPVALALGLSGAIGIGAMQDIDVALSALGSLPYTSTARFGLVVVPMFILMGVLAVHARLAEQIFEIAQVALRRFPGGLGVATVAACAGFAAVSGSSIATAATFSRLSISEMRKYGYRAEFAVGIVAAAGTLGVMIPPSVLLVFYGIVANQSIGALLLAGIIPGILSAVVYAALIMARSRSQIVTPERALLASGGGGTEVCDLGAANTKGKLPFRALFRVAVLFTIVVGGVYTGYFTVSESGAMGATGALLILFLERRRDSWNDVKAALIDAAKQTGSVTSMVFAIVVGASIFSYFLASSGVVNSFVDSVIGLGLPPMLAVAFLLVLLIPLGMALDSFSIIAIIVPLALPIVDAYGMSGIWFGVLVIKMAELGMITPPVGINVFVTVGSTDGVTAEQGFRGITPFALTDLFTVGLLFAVPALTLWLPTTSGLL